MGVKFLDAALKIRQLDEADIDAVSAICMVSFLKSVAGTLSEEGVSTFSKISSSDSFLRAIGASGNLWHLILAKPFGVGGFSKLSQVRCLKLPLAPVFTLFTYL